MSGRDPEFWRAISVIAMSVAAVLIFAIYIWWQANKMRAERICPHLSWSVREKVNILHSDEKSGNAGFVFIMECDDCGDIRWKELRA